MLKWLLGRSVPRELDDGQVMYLAEHLSLSPFMIDLATLDGMRVFEMAPMTPAQKGSLVAELRLLGLVACLYSLYEPGANLSRSSIVKVTAATAERFVARPFFTPDERTQLTAAKGGLPEWIIYDMPDAKPMLFNQRYEWYCALWPNPAALGSSEKGAKAAIQIMRCANLEEVPGLILPLVLAVGLVFRIMLPCASIVLKDL